MRFYHSVAWSLRIWLDLLYNNIVFLKFREDLRCILLQSHHISQVDKTSTFTVGVVIKWQPWHYHRRGFNRELPSGIPMARMRSKVITTILTQEYQKAKLGTLAFFHQTQERKLMGFFQFSNDIMYSSTQVITVSLSRTLNKFIASAVKSLRLCSYHF